MGIPSDILGLGAPAQVGTFIVVLAACIRLIIPWRKQTLDSQSDQVKIYKETCESLRGDVKHLTEKLFECEDKCDRDIKALHEEIFGIRKQNLAEQISLINVIINSVDAPELRNLLRTLESVQVALSLRPIETSQSKGTNGNA